MGQLQRQSVNRVIRVNFYETLGYVELSVTDCFGISWD